MATVRREPLLVFYEGACGVCTRSIAWALNRDRYQRLVPVAAGSPLARDAVGPEHAPHLLDELHVWSESGGVRKGVDAVAALLIRLPGLAWAGHVLAFPLVRPFARDRASAMNTRRAYHRFAGLKICTRSSVPFHPPFTRRLLVTPEPFNRKEMR